MIVHLPIPPNKVKLLIALAESRGFTRKDTEKAWTDTEKRNAVTFAVRRVLNKWQRESQGKSV
jgi:hypothetical protein